MFTTFAETYDLIYSRVKDYEAESARIVDLVREHNPSCRSVLDVACGTGEHARRLAAAGFTVDGLDIDPTFVRMARQKHPEGEFVEADMTAFALPHRYDAVLCLFSSIGYARTMDATTRALRCFREHLEPGGIVVVEPWLTPGVLDPTRTGEDMGEGGGVRVVRRSRVEIDGSVSRLLFDYEITDASGTRHTNEVHELGLFTTNEMLQAFSDAGLAAQHDPKGLGDRGLFVARRSA